MRIALVSQEYPPETAHGGIGSQTYRKAHDLASLGHEMRVVSLSVDGCERRSRDGAVEVLRVPTDVAGLAIATEPTRWLCWSLAAAAAVARLHAEKPLDLVDFPEWGGEGYVHLLNRTPWSHVPTVIHLHGPLVMLASVLGWPERDSDLYRVGTEMEGTSLRLADAVFSSSDCSADWCAKHYGIPRESIPRLHTGVDVRSFAPRDLPRDPRPTLLFAGNLSESKGALTLLAAALRLAGEVPGLRLRMLGRGDLAERLRAEAAAAGRSDLLELPGFVAREDLPHELARADVFAAPSVYEGGPGFVYLEAMACGLPVIAGQNGGAGEVVRDGETGCLVPPGDVEALVAALRRLLLDPDLRRTMGRRARRFVEQEAASEDCARRIEAFYAGVVARSARPQDGGA